jgi:hypothetical protein
MVSARALLHVGDLRRDHGQLGLVEMPPVQVLADHEVEGVAIACAQRIAVRIFWGFGFGGIGIGIGRASPRTWMTVDGKWRALGEKDTTRLEGAGEWLTNGISFSCGPL